MSSTEMADTVESWLAGQSWLGLEMSSGRCSRGGDRAPDGWRESSGGSRGGARGASPPPPHTQDTHTNYLGLCSVDPACIGCSDMRKSYKKDYTWSRSGYAIVHHCEYN